MYATDVTFVVRQLMKIAHQFVDEFTKKKLLVYGENYREAMEELIEPENLEVKYGGTLPNIESNFFPPSFNP